MSSIEIKIEGGAPPDAPDFGFAELGDMLAAGATLHRRYITITVWDVHEGNTDFDTGERKLKLRARSIEPMIETADKDQALAMHDRAHGVRTGEVTLGIAAGDDV